MAGTRAMPTDRACRWLRAAARAVAVLVLLGCWAGPARAQGAQPASLAAPAEVRQVRVEERLGAQLPLELAFRDEQGGERTLGELLAGGRPAVLMLVYYECPSLCNHVLNAWVEAARAIRYRLGEDYTVITVSIDPGEGPELAAAKERAYLEALGRPQQGAGWHWLTGEETRIRALAEAVGFHYLYDPVQDEYAHPAALYVLTPGGRVSRQLDGLSYTPQDLELALLEASEGRIASGLLDRLRLVCYRYDPEARGYVVSAIAAMQIGGAVLAAGLGALLAALWLRERRRARLAGLAGSENA
ncbi:MAG: electron transporter SenC [Planctomycetota bacterium]|nr:MAG: electron transporter SenC [Planctomycetota bacterium]